MNVRHIIGIYGETDTAVLSSKAPFFDPSSVSLSGVPSDS